MRVEYSKRSIADLYNIAAYHATVGTPETAERVAVRVAQVIDRISRFPNSGRPVARRPGVRVVSLRRCRYNLFYRVRGDIIRIVHIRHTSRRPRA